MTTDSPTQSKPSTIVIAATFVAEPVEPALAFWMEQLEVPARIIFAPYNQVFQALLDPSGLVARNQTGVNVILVRFDDWLGGPGGDDGPREGTEQLERNVRDLLQALTTAARRAPASYLVCITPATPATAADPVRAALFTRMEELVASSSDGIAGVYVVKSAELMATYPVAEYADSHTDKVAHIPFTPLFFTALGSVIARKVYALKSVPYKVLVLDCDETLWGGVCGEDGPLGVRLDGAHQALQEFAVRQHDAGMLLCLCSKNNEADVAEVFERRADVVLRRSQLASWRINWRPKSENIRSLAHELRLGLDSMIFLDDDPVECAEVQANCPEVLVLRLPRDPARRPAFLANLWVFDRLKVTDEGRVRTVRYQQEGVREVFREGSPTLKEFLAGLALKIQIATPAPHQLARVAELTQRTNQFNLTTIRRSEPEIRQLCESGRMESLAVHVKDRFGDYGLVGVLLFTVDGAVMTVDTLLLSCRALGRGVEHRMLARLGEIAVERGLVRVDVPCIPSGRNEPAIAFLEAFGGEFKQARGDGHLFGFAAEVAAAVRIVPPERDAALAGGGAGVGGGAPGAPPARSSGGAPATRAKEQLLSSIALELQEAAQIHEVIASQARGRPELETAFVPPRTEIERKVAELYSELLGVKEIGVHDSFFDLGGHSLLATRVLSRVHEAFGVELGIHTILTPKLTVEELAKTVVEESVRRADSQEVASLVSRLESLSDDEVRALLDLEGGPGETQGPS